MKIVVLDGFALNPGDLSWDGLKKLGDCLVYDRTAPEEIYSRMTDAEMVVTNKVAINQKMMRRLPKLKYIGVTATGYNVVDMQAANQLGITVTNIPAYSTDSVAQLVFSHILNILNHVELHATSVRSGEWVKKTDFSYWKTPQTELAGKTLGIIGFGRIGRKVAQIGLAFGMEVIFQNRSQVVEIQSGIRQTGIAEVFTQSDVISINCPLTEENREFINVQVLGKMKKTAILINTGRGGLINETDLAMALNTGVIAAAGLDVLSTEPPMADNPLINARNCFITPHIAWATIEARKRLLEITIENLKCFMMGKPQNIVN